MSLNDTTYGWDVSNYQADLTEQHFRNAKNEGIEFSIALATDGTGFQNFMFARQLDWGRKVGMLTSSYHYVRDASISQQIANIKRTVPLDCPVIPDSEHGSGGIDVLNKVISALLNEGYKVPLEYLPRWYWQIIGSPSLSGRGRPLWASWYPDYVRRNKEAGAAMLPASVWSGYGGAPVAITQFTSSGAAAGYSRALDLNKFRGTRDELALLLGGRVTGGPAPQRGKKKMDVLVRIPGGDAIYVVSVTSVGCGVRHLTYEEAIVLAKDPAYKVCDVTPEEFEAVLGVARQEPLDAAETWNHKLPVGDGSVEAKELPGRILQAIGEVQVPELDYDRLAEAVAPLLENSVTGVVETAFEGVLSRLSLSVKDEEGQA